MSTVCLQSARAARFSIAAPCRNEVIVDRYFDLSAESKTVGQVTIEQLNLLYIPYIGSERGLNTMYNTPVDLEAIDIVARDEMYAYGWCYSVNGVSPEVYMDEVEVGPDDVIHWWYGYAHYYQGEWLTQCSSSHLREHTNFCQNLIPTP